jgi:hypothetical protein
MPPKNQYPGENLSGFSFVGRMERRLLIKEVNPRATSFYCQYYQPFILFLLRHPAAVALSFWEMGWLTAPDVQLEAVDLEGDDWEKFGYAYGVTMKNALDTLKRLTVMHKIIIYEQLASEPLSEFKKIFDYLNIEIPENYKEIIEEYCFSGSAAQGYHTRRVSKAMIAKWMDNLSLDAITKIRKGYLQSGLSYYQSDLDWKLTGIVEND